MAVLARTLPRARLALAPSSGWFLFATVLAVTLAPLASVHMAGWAPGTEIIFPIAIVGALVSVFLCHRRMRSGWIVAIGFVSAFAVAYLVASEAFPDPISAVSNFVALFGDTITWVQLRQAGDVAAEQPMLGALDTSWDALVDLYFRLEAWLSSVFSLQVSRDNVVFTFWISMAAWGMGYASTWAAFRLRRALLALAPGTLAIAINITYIGADWAPFAIFLFAAMTLTVQMHLLNLERRWKSERTDYSSDLGSFVVVASVGMSALIVALALLLPRAGGNPLAEAFWTYMGDGWANVEAGIQRVFGGVSNPSGSALGGRETLGLSGPQPFGQGGTLIIESTNPSYWRGQTFDVYTGQSWRSTYRELEEREPNEPVNPEINLRSRAVSRSNIEILDSNSAVLYAPGDPVRLNRRYLVQVSEGGDAIQDFASIRATRRIGQRLVYNVDSTLSVATVTELRQAPLALPDWANAYVELPTLPERVQELARRLGEAGETPYDRAQAVEFFMRRFPYAIDTVALPPDRDAVDYFLFDLRQGHAAQIASTTAVLMRANGLPARIAVGYARGTFDSLTSRYIVSPEDSHSWVEVYFPEYGWITFEPSGFRVPVGRAEGGATSASGDAGGGDFDDLDDFLDDLDDELNLGGSFTPINPDTDTSIFDFIGGFSGPLLVLLGLVGVLGLFLLVYLLSGVVRERLLAPRAAAQRTYRRMARAAQRAGYNSTAAMTPRELSRRLVDDLYPVGSPKRLAIAGHAPPEVLAETFLRAMYSRHIISRTDKKLVQRAWRDLRGRLWRRSFQRTRPKFPTIGWRQRDDTR